MGFFDRFRRRDRDDVPGKVHASGKTLDDLKEFLGSRQGVEAFVEPPTSVYAMTLVLVAGDGEYMRRPVKDEKQAHEICKAQGVPVYDARIVGYPKRMRDFERGQRSNPIGLEDLPPLETTDEEPDRGLDDD